MIQRIQTVYLLFVAGLFIALQFLPLAVVQADNVLYSFDVTGVNTTVEPSELILPTWSLMAIAGIIILLSFATIFTYKKRILQIRMCLFNGLLMIGFCALFGFYAWKISHAPDFSSVSVNLRLWASFPIIALILDYLAIRNIGADEALVRSLERLR